MSLEDQRERWRQYQQGHWPTKGKKGKKKAGADTVPIQPCLGGVYMTPGYHNIGGHTVELALPVKKGWRAERDEVETCGRVPKNATIVISDLAYRKIEVGLEELKHSEWLAYLLGRVNGFSAQVDDLLVPSQSVTVASVAVLETPENPAIIGTVHTHPGGLSNGFSGTDESFILGNWPVSILAGTNGYKGIIRANLPCGAEMSLDANVQVELPPGAEGFKQELQEKVQQDNRVVPKTSGVSGYGVYDGVFE